MVCKLSPVSAYDAARSACWGSHKAGARCRHGPGTCWCSIPASSRPAQQGLLAGLGTWQHGGLSVRVMLRAWGENEVTQPSALASQSFTRARSCLAPPWQSMVEEGVIEKFIGLDMSDAETVFDRCLEAIQRVKKVCGAVGG